MCQGATESPSPRQGQSPQLMEREVLQLTAAFQTTATFLIQLQQEHT